MMEKILLCLCLCLSGWNVSSCLPRQYHYVADPMTWTEAQTFCRKTYTDLASIGSPEEMKQVNHTITSSGLNSEVWIGLYNRIIWKWSDSYTGSGAEYRKWYPGQPNFWNAKVFCVGFSRDGWADVGCYGENTFFCYQGTQQDPEYVFVNQKMNWSDAQSYCRENHIDLAIVRNDNENQQLSSIEYSGKWPFIGLYRDRHLYWSDRSSLSFTFWDPVESYLGSMTVVCGVSDLERSGKWRFLPCERKLPFVCHTASQQVKVIKLRMTGKDPSVDLNDLAVKADILKKLQDRLKESGLSGVTLRWREQPDGKVFHKEAESSQKESSKWTQVCD
ncbi:secretory phospholipase A2 receptor-like [Xyrichtys novacula]|uniref:Secretory phospholipase A2 receptor-like n=1 Tax=Xyrichtys novacula TaxID=13765 RepID=A0AAV1H667_XYRNO|nr:secretory phospholipase A2 receptor-like [Xyrichtys novacula]